MMGTIILYKPVSPVARLNSVARKTVRLELAERGWLKGSEVLGTPQRTRITQPRRIMPHAGF